MQKRCRIARQNGVNTEFKFGVDQFDQSVAFQKPKVIFEHKYKVENDRRNVENDFEI